MSAVLLIHKEKGFSWFNRGSLSVKGYFFDRSSNFYEKEKLLDYFSEIRTFADLEERVRFANGCFTVILSNNDEIYVACDPIRAFPVFYTKGNGNWILSDAPEQLLKYTPFEKNAEACEEFLAAGYVTGDETLINGIRQVQAGEIIHLKNGDRKSKFFFNYRTHYTSENEYEELKAAGKEVFESTFRRFVNGLGGRTVVVPLSGGYDSRLIAVMLKKAGYKNVVCMTYGRPENPEIRISRKVAEKLGFRWICVEYSKELISGFLNDNSFREYYPFAANLSSMFFFQEFFAVRYLKENKLVPDDSIFTPGHAGDFLGGSHLGKFGNLLDIESLTEIAQRIFFNMYGYVRPKGRVKERMIERIEKNLEEKFTGRSELAYSIQEDWDFREKLAKFNTNSVSTYTFFGYEFRLPYWDSELVNFFKNLPLHVKVNKYLYDDILTSYYFESEGVNFDEELQVSEKVVRKQRVKNRIKLFLPQFVLRFFLSKQDDMCYSEITAQLIEDMERKGKKISIYNNSYNSLIIQWYLKELERSGIITR
jgi:asparagine synthase (glutamine-hydrolysing)